MSTFRIKPSRLQGHIAIPSSKSHTLRSLIFGLMAKGKTRIHRYLPSPDTEAMLAAIRSLGAEVHVGHDILEIEGVAGILHSAEDIIQCGNSGQVLRFIGALAALMPTYTILTGDASIRHNRPVRPLLEALKQLGAFAESSRQNGYAPIVIKGPISHSHAALSGEDSQPVSALLIAASFLPFATILKVYNPGETPWIDLTLDWLKRLGISVSHRNYEEYAISGNAAYEGFERTIPGDFSSAAYPIAAAVLTGSELVLSNVDMGDVQGDKRFIDLLIQMGARIECDLQERKLRVRPGGELRGMKMDINNCIDMVTILPVIACFAEGETEIINAAIARAKESDRIHAIATELRKMGALIEERVDGLKITPSKLKGAELQSYSDHRMALALSVAALAAEGESCICGIDCIQKTYPTFKTDMQRIGADIA